MAHDLSLAPKVEAFVRHARVGRLATIGDDGMPYLVPFCFVLIGHALYLALDAKPKRVSIMKLKRVRNILERPHVGIIIDRWSEDWSELAYVQIRGRASLLTEGDERAGALVALREKYPQYRSMPIEENPTIKISIEAATGWGAID